MIISFWDRLSRKEKTGLLIAFLIVLVAFADRLGVSAFRNYNQKLEAEVKNKEKQLVQYLILLSQKDFIEKKFASYDKYIMTDESGEDLQTSTLKEIERILNETRVSVLSLKPKNPRVAPFFLEYLVDVSAEGELISILKFLHQVDSSPLLLRADKVVLTAQNPGNENLRAAFQISRLVEKKN
jgi:hypothetical protein